MIGNMWKKMCDNISYVVDNNLILEYLCCGPNWRRKCLLMPMCAVRGQLNKTGYYFYNNMLLKLPDKCCSESHEFFDYNAISSDPKERWAIYSQLEDAITTYVYQSLVTYRSMVPLAVPKGYELGRGTFIFVTREFEKNDVLLILIPGTEDIRAGQWSRNAIMEYGLNAGSQLPYVKKAIESGYGVMIMNPSDNYRGSSIPHSGTPKEHGKHVWDAYVRPCKASKILIVAHIYGGIVASCLANRRKREFQKRVAGVALIDSLHVYCEFNVTTFFKKVSKHWVTKDSPVDTPLLSPYFDVTKVSSGDSRPGVTPYSCMNSVFKFFEEKLSTPQVITQQVTLV